MKGSARVQEKTHRKHKHTHCTHQLSLSLSHHTHIHTHISSLYPIPPLPPPLSFSSPTRFHYKPSAAGSAHASFDTSFIKTLPGCLSTMYIINIIYNYIQTSTHVVNCPRSPSARSLLRRVMDPPVELHVDLCALGSDRPVRATHGIHRELNMYIYICFGE